MLTHVVLFKLKDRSRESAERVREVLLGMRGRIPQLREIEVGIDVLRSDRSYDVALITRFDDLAAMEAYQDDPAHREVIAFMREVRESSVTVDFEG
jgi:heme-degrading monooxygenase HmoA